MMKRVMVVALVLGFILALAVPIGAQDNGVVPPPTGEVEQGIGLLEYLVAVSLVVAMIVEQLKPVVFMPIRERYSERVYLGLIYLTRTVLGVVAVLAYGGAAVMVDHAPALVGVPETIVVATGALLVAAGTEIIHPLLDILYALRNRVEQPGEPVEIEEQAQPEAIRG
jgi:hypothetical protein